MESTEYALMDVAEDHMWWYRALHERLLDRLSGVQGVVLDAGCGTGGFLSALKRHRPDLASIGCELAEVAAARAVGKSGTSVVRCSVNALPFATASFDAVVSADVLCHAAVHVPLALAETIRVLKPRGRLVLNMPAYRWLYSDHDKRVHNVRRITGSALRAALAAAGFTDIRAGYWNTLLLPLMVLHRIWSSRSGRGRGKSDVRPFPPWLDTALYGIAGAEHMLGGVFPVGGSVLAVAAKSSD